MTEKDPFDRSFDSFTELADTLYEVLGCPVTIENAAHQLIAYSSHSPQTDAARIATIVGRRVPEKVISTLWESGVIKQLTESDDPVRISAVSEVGLGDRVAVSIRNHNDVLGYIWALEEQGVHNPRLFPLLKKAAEASRTLLLQLQIQKRKEEESQQSFFWQLLTSGLASGWLIRQKAEQLHIVLPPQYRVTVFQFESDVTGKAYREIQYMISVTQSVKIVFHALNGRHLVLLASTSDAEQASTRFNAFIETFISQMEERFSVYPIRGACGSRHHDYTMVESSYREALAVLKLKPRFRQLQHTHLYEELGFYRYLPVMAEVTHDDTFEQRCLHRLSTYDREHNNCLLDTLDVFLNNDSNIKDTADALHIHINTLNYRLKRIAEIGGIDLKNTDHKVSLYLALKMKKQSDG
ncbi:PucR family transcriptional regulator [Paenibacillus allorhizosphaerae]|uniref:Proline-responsive transcriptional activator PutR n=1 Tax=Paenibacillus allorhizosphaerae TaxID=2849866 RepID=A0ABM8VBT3_9BACL|nr:PucR family transcriptional regulator [Paenibacillus allorhizosphaerae]CAG7618559.1 Proline-responsive transcriptional activator PutR [Paenibacillus allorhizosphaerae]